MQNRRSDSERLSFISFNADPELSHNLEVVGSRLDTIDIPEPILQSMLVQNVRFVIPISPFFFGNDCPTLTSFPSARWQTSFRWDSLSSQMQEYPDTVCTNKSVLMLMVEPLEALLHSPWCQLLMLLVGGYLVAEGASIIMAFGKYGIVHFAAYRLTLQGGMQNSSAVSGFTLLYRGCPVLHRSLSPFEIMFPEAVAMDGFHLRTNSSNPGPGPFRLEGSPDDGVTWLLIGAPNPRLTLRGVRFVPGDGADPSRTVFDHRPPWTLGVACGAHILAGLALCTAAAAVPIASAISRRAAAGCDLLLRLRPGRCAAALAAGLAALEAARLGRVEQWRDAFQPAAMCAVCCAAAAAFLLAGRHLPLRITAVSIAWAAVRVVDDCAVFSDCGNLTDNPPYPAAAALLASLAIELAAARAARAARVAAAGDQRRYAAAWDNVRCRESAALQRLASAADGLAAAACDGANESSGTIVGGQIGPSASRGTLRQGGPVPACLDMLWAQAVGLAPLLALRAAAWADAGGGAFRLPPSASRADCGGRRASSASGKAEAGLGVGGKWWAGGGDLEVGGGGGAEDWRWLVKDPRRAAWKARSCYGGDAGRLLDLCRARLVFPDAGGMAACLRTLEADPAARVLRVRNGMRDGGGGVGGFRVRPLPPPVF